MHDALLLARQGVELLAPQRPPLRAAGTWQAMKSFGPGDCVTYDGSSWACTAAHVAGDTFDHAKFRLMVKRGRRKGRAVIVTAADAPPVLADVLDARIETRLAELEQRIRADLAASGPEDDHALDEPPDPDADWRRVSVEELLLMERARLEAWRDALLASFDRH